MPEPSQSVEVGSGQPAGIDYVSLVGVVVLGILGCFALEVGNDQVALAVGTGIVGFMARLYIGRG